MTQRRSTSRMRYAAWATLTEAGHAAHPGNTLFRVPHRLDYQHLVPVETIERDGVTMLRLPEHHWRPREGFALTDNGMNTQQALDQINYCIWCHTQGKDSCRHGLKDRKSGAFQKSPFGVTLAGCPLDEKISEMHTLRAQGSAIGAFAIIAIDNPMMAATGHRICNDCMKACIYQRQDPVDIPQAETRVLKDVLDLPWGFEIYALLTRWNPLDIRRPLPRPDSGRKVLIVGLGPAGFTLAHHLMNDGHTVVAIDGLKIEPLGFDPAAPVRDAEQLFENLDDRVMAGFGGVAEYGITVRWNKNYLKLVRLLLERAGTIRAFRRHPLRRRRHSRHRRCLGDGVRPHRAVHGRGQADGARHPQRTGAWRARGVRLPDGAAADRRGQAVVDRQSATAAAGRGHRRRADRDRYRDREPGLLRAPGGEVRRALPDPGRGARRGHGARARGMPRRPASPTSSWRTRRRSRPSARRRRGRAGRLGSRNCSMRGAAPPSPIAAG